MLKRDKEKWRIIKNYRLQERSIQLDNRYTPQLRQWALMELLDTFEKNHNCSPDEMESSLCQQK